MRGLNAPPRKRSAPAFRTFSAAANACSRLSMAQGPAMTASSRPPNVTKLSFESPTLTRITESSFFTSRLTSLYGFETGMASATPGSVSNSAGSSGPGFPVIPMAVRCAPGIG